MAWISAITLEMGDDAMHVKMRQIMALFDEHQSKENAKHVMQVLKENARQGFWNGSLSKAAAIGATNCERCHGMSRSMTAK